MSSETGPREEDARLRKIRTLLEMFKTERWIYIGVTLAALAILFICAVFLIFFHKGSIGIGLGLFGSSGAITFAISRLLTMYTQAFNVVFGDEKGKKDDK